MSAPDPLSLAVRILRERALEAPKCEQPEYAELARHLERAGTQANPLAIAAAMAYLTEAL